MPSRSLDVATSVLSTVLRFGGGLAASHPVARQPEKLLELYEFEACPFCRKVREALTAFDLDALVRPCPKGGARFRASVPEPRFPYLVDPNTGRSMHESNDIIGYLATTYGDGRVPFGLSLGPLTVASSGLASAVRPSRGRSVQPSKAPERPLELWSFEGSPYCRIAREALCELELPYILHNVGKGSSKRAAFVARSGKMQVPYLVDPNTGAALFESADIVIYLAGVYGPPEAPHPASA